MIYNNELEANTIKRIEKHPFTVDDSGSKRRPYYLDGIGQVNFDELYMIANTLDAYAIKLLGKAN